MIALKPYSFLRTYTNAFCFPPFPPMYTTYCRVVKGVFAFPQWDMLVVATSSPGYTNLGKLRVSHLPTDAQLAAAADRQQQASATPHKVPQPTVDLPVCIIKVHTQALQAATRLVSETRHA